MRRDLLLRGWLTGALLAACLGLAGCVVSPQPEPPSIDISLLTLAWGDSGLVLTGAAGAVQHGSSIVGLDLDTTAPSASAAVDAQGAFTLPLTGAATDAFRLQAFDAALRSPPVDVTTGDGLTQGGPVLLAPEVLADCFGLAPALEVGPLAAGASAKVTMTNACTVDVTVDALTLRLGSPAWQATGALPIVMPAGLSGSFTVSFDPHAGDALDDVLLVGISAPAKGRRPLTLRGPSP